MLLKSDNIDFVSYYNTNKAVEKRFESWLSRCQSNIEKDSIQFNCCITNFPRQILQVVDHILILQTGLKRKGQQQ